MSESKKSSIYGVAVVEVLNGKVQEIKVESGNVLKEVKAEMKSVFEGQAVCPTVADTWLNKGLCNLGYSFNTKERIPARKSKSKFFVVEIHFTSNKPVY
jgi:hypothetical protein